MFWFPIQCYKINNKGQKYQVHLCSSKGQMLLSDTHENNKTGNYNYLEIHKTENLFENS